MSVYANCGPRSKAVESSDRNFTHRLLRCLDGEMSSTTCGLSILHHKVQKFSSGTGSPGWSRKKGRKTVVVAVVFVNLSIPFGVVDAVGWVVHGIQPIQTYTAYLRRFSVRTNGRNEARVNWLI